MDLGGGGFVRLEDFYVGILGRVKLAFILD